LFFTSKKKKNETRLKTNVTVEAKEKIEVFFSRSNIVNALKSWKILWHWKYLFTERKNEL